MSKRTSAKVQTRSAAGARNAASAGGPLRSAAGTNWSLPSGEGLLDFAVRFGFLAPALLGAGDRGRRPRLWEAR
jgi:hypothetical protein